MSQTTVPRTPTPEALDNDDLSPLQSPHVGMDGLSNRRSQVAMTPPPSNQLNLSHRIFGHANYFMQLGASLASPPSTLRTDPPISAGALYGEVPTMDTVNNMNEEELRRLVIELVPALGEARVTAAHSKLQHSLLSIQTDESIKRAEVEHEATRREVQVLQEGSPAPHHTLSPIVSPQASVQRNLHLALSHCGELQRENALLKKRLKSSKKLISQLDGENADLKEKVHLLRQRIKDNRDHLNELQESGAISLTGTPQHEFATPFIRDTPKTPATSRSTRHIGGDSIRSRDPLGALLQAAKLDPEPLGGPPSPSQQRQRRLHNHIRGAHSLSSLPMTPERRPITAEGAPKTPSDRFSSHKASFSAPGMQLVYEPPRRQQDRESTISASDNEDDIVEEDEPTSSQASQMASDMLRRTLEAQKERSPPSRHVSASMKLNQGKLYGHLQKPRGGPVGSPLKRKAQDDGYEIAGRGRKMAKAVESARDKIGLGIGGWPSPAR